jgi:hypothetical protein
MFMPSALRFSEQGWRLVWSKPLHVALFNPSVSCLQRRHSKQMTGNSTLRPGGSAMQCSDFQTWTDELDDEK